MGRVIFDHFPHKLADIPAGLDIFKNTEGTGFNDAFIVDSFLGSKFPISEQNFDCNPIGLHWYDTTKITIFNLSRGGSTITKFKSILKYKQ